MEAVLGSEAAKLAAEGSLQEGGILSAQDYVLNIINNVQKLFITCKLCASSAHLLAMSHVTRLRGDNKTKAECCMAMSAYSIMSALSLRLKRQQWPFQTEIGAEPMRSREGMCCEECAA